MLTDCSTKLSTKISTLAPDLDELANVIRTGIGSNFVSVDVQVVDCPDLSKDPFNLAATGLGGHARIAEVGGIGNLLPVTKVDKIYELSKIATTCDLPNAFVLGPGAGPRQIVGTNCEMVANCSFAQHPPKLATWIAKLSPTSDGHVQEALQSTSFSFLANLLLCDGQPGKVLKISAKHRIGSATFPESIRKSLADHYREETVSLGGVFLLNKGKAKLHIMPDFPAEQLADIAAVDNWLHFYTASSPLLCISVMHSYDPGYSLRSEHTHCFSDHGDAGHLHYDTTPDTVEYEGFFVPAQMIYRIDQVPKNVVENGIVKVVDEAKNDTENSTNRDVTIAIKIMDKLENIKENGTDKEESVLKNDAEKEEPSSKNERDEESKKKNLKEKGIDKQVMIIKGEGKNLAKVPIAARLKNSTKSIAENGIKIEPNESQLDTMKDTSKLKDGSALKMKSRVSTEIKTKTLVKANLPKSKSPFVDKPKQTKVEVQLKGSETKITQREVRPKQKIMAKKPPINGADKTALEPVDISSEALRLVIPFLSYDETARCRLVNSQFDSLCGERLNTGYRILLCRTSEIQGRIRTFLPLHKTDRRDHPAMTALTSFECFVINPIEAISPALEEHLCCFPYGFLLDAAFNFLTSLENFRESTNFDWKSVADLSRLAAGHYQLVMAPDLEHRLGDSFRLKAAYRLQELDTWMSETNINNKERAASIARDDMSWEMDQLRNQSQILKKENRDLRRECMNLDTRVEMLEHKFKTIGRLLQ